MKRIINWIKSFLGRPISAPAGKYDNDERGLERKAGGILRRMGDGQSLAIAGSADGCDPKLIATLHRQHSRFMAQHNPAIKPDLDTAVPAHGLVDDPDWNNVETAPFNQHAETVAHAAQQHINNGDY